MENSKLKIAILTGDELRHKFYANSLTHTFDVVLIAHEKKANVHEKTDFGDKGNNIVVNHFSKRTANEERYFSNPPTSFAQKTVFLNNGDVNKKGFVNLLVETNPDYVLLFGSSLIGDDILLAFPKKVINLHLGLSPYYRGSGTLFWPLVDQLPECAGSTIHLAIKKIDAGGILGQVRPELDASDDSHDIGNKTILASLKAIPGLVKGFHLGEVKPLVVDMSEGKLCLRRHLSSEAIRQLYQNLEKGILSSYLKSKELRDGKFPIIENI
jgi:methionyl-tRNA formyltransferase